MEDKANSEANIRFPDYIFTEMANEDEDNFAKKCNKTKAVTARKTANVRRCLSDNLLLLVTVAGVLFGVVLGEFAFFSFIQVKPDSVKWDPSNEI
jgi:F0F1-type ATP synthase assembly protein I